MGTMTLLVIVPSTASTSFADMEMKSTLNLNVVDVREIEGRKSPNMERVGFERGLHELPHIKWI